MQQAITGIPRPKIAQHKLKRIKELFILLKSGYDYMVTHEDSVDENMGLIERAKPIFEELETLGVDKDFSQALFFLGGVVTETLLDQFKDTDQTSQP